MTDVANHTPRSPYTNRHVIILIAAVMFFALAALSEQTGHPVLFTALTWAFCGAAAYVASQVP